MPENKFVPWFEMLDGLPRYIGYFKEFDDAAEKAFPSASWIFDEDALKEFITAAEVELDRARNSS